ncbi:uncharacterized protein BJX67DRAFT_298951 [Aspergillus lucknowensis]|uniref:Secreted protein n=1 Tax=Aspergillus lucknowensis TaxID=176173 RepID=A0ABR4LCW1_9EURO
MRGDRFSFSFLSPLSVGHSWECRRCCGQPQGNRSVLSRWMQDDARSAYNGFQKSSSIRDFVHSHCSILSHDCCVSAFSGSDSLPLPPNLWAEAPIGPKCPSRCPTGRLR